jgi:hypothetical protein
LGSVGRGLGSVGRGVGRGVGPDVAADFGVEVPAVRRQAGSDRVLFESTALTAITPAPHCGSRRRPLGITGLLMLPPS